MQVNIPEGMLYGLLMLAVAWLVALYFIFIVFNVDQPKDSSSEQEEPSAE